MTLFEHTGSTDADTGVVNLSQHGGTCNDACNICITLVLDCAASDDIYVENVQARDKELSEQQHANGQG